MADPLALFLETWKETWFLLLAVTKQSRFRRLGHSALLTARSKTYLLEQKIFELQYTNSPSQANSPTGQSLWEAHGADTMVQTARGIVLIRTSAIRRRTRLALWWSGRI